MIREKGMPNLKPSRTDAGLAEKVRSSTSYFFSQEQERASPEIMAVKHRATAISHVTLEHQEELQIQHYKEPRMGGQKKDFYIPHFDWIPNRPRVATLLIYLEEPEQGGETIFPFVRHNSSNRNAQLYTRQQAEPLTLAMWNAGACEAAPDASPWLRIRPRKGAAILFYNIHPDNSLDALSIHGSCPVIKGQKTVLQQWLSTIWMAPIYSPGIAALWRNPAFKGALPGSVDASGRLWPLRLSLRETSGVDGSVEGAAAVEQSDVCSARGVLRDSEDSRQFSLSLMMAVEHCSGASVLRARVMASRTGAKAPAIWDLRVSDCQISLAVPGASEPPLTATISKNEWAHVTVLTEDLAFDPIRGNSSKTWEFKSHLIVQGVAGAKSVRGKVKYEKRDAGKTTGSLNWERSRVCLSNPHPHHADFSQVYLLSRQLSAAEVQLLRKKSAADRIEPRPGMV